MVKIINMNENILLEHRFRKMSEFRFLLWIENYYHIVLRKENDKFYLSDYTGYDRISKEIKDIEQLKTLVFALCCWELKPIN